MKEPLPPLTWTSDLVWKLISEMQRPENFRVLFGKTEASQVSTYIYLKYIYITQSLQNTVGKTKIAVYKQIGSVILPDEYAKDAEAIGRRVKNKADEYVYHFSSQKQY